MSSARPATEHFAGAMAFFGLPLIDVIVVIGTGTVQDTQVSMVLLPLLFASLCAVLCRVLDVSFWWAAVYVPGCAGACWIASGIVGLFDSFFLPW